MGRIQSSIGLITGVPIQETVDQLISISARPRDLLISRNAALRSQQVATTELTALVIGLQLAVDTLGEDDVFSQREVTSSAESLLSATVTGTPAVGVSQYTPVRQAQSHQVIGTGYANLEDPVGAGTLSIRFGARVDDGIDLSQLNSSGGVQRGKIRITDRSGAVADIDLRFARSVDDVLEAINSATGVNVTATTSGGSFALVDNTGQTASNLKVVQVGQGTTATDLGLAGIDVAANSATGQDVLLLHDDLELSSLNDGNGVNIRDGVADLSVSFRDNSAALEIEFHATGNDEQTVGELIDTINAADPARLSAQISADGKRIELTDLTADSGGTFAVSSTAGGSVAEDLGLDVTAAGAAISGRLLQGGLKSTLLSTLGGGGGLGDLGLLDLTNRNGDPTVSVDLSSAETLEDVIASINGAGAGITARVNDARNGIVLTDTSGGSGSLVVANNADATLTADKLQIAVNASVGSINSGSLDRQVISEQTKLDSLNNGRGISTGSFLITDTSGASGAINLAVTSFETVGELIDAVNGLGIGVTAQINDSGDGISIVDTAGGAGLLSVTDSGSGKAAADLRIAGSTATGTIDGSNTFSITIDADDTLQDVVDAVNALDVDVAASIFNDGSGTPFRLTLTSEIAGKAGTLVVDTKDAAFSVQEVVRGQDALLLIGSPDSLGAGLLASSTSNTFDSVLDGVSLTLKGTSTDPVTISVDSTDSSLIKKVQAFVDQYNKLRDKIDDLTFFNETDNSTGVLFGSGEIVRLESSLTNLLTRRFVGVGDIQSLESVGIGISAEGKLSLDTDKLKDRFESDPDDVKALFATEDLGVADKFHALVETLAGEGNSLLINRNDTLQRRIDVNAERIDFLTAKLDRERERLLKTFFDLENIIGRLQSNLSVVNALQPIPPL